MDVFCDAREVMRRFERYVIDLRRLFTFHGLACGAAENFCDLAVKLEESRALRLDLPALLRNIRDLEQGEMAADEMLTVVALASGGEELVEGRAGSAGMMRTVGMLQMMLAGVGTWAETSGEERTAKAVTTEPSTGEDRVFLELAIEELRLQLGAVTRRLSELQPQIHATIEPVGGAVGGEHLVADPIGRDADRYAMIKDDEALEAELWAADRALAERAAEERGAAERAATERAAATFEADRAAAERKAAERAAATFEADRAAAERKAAERAAAETALLEKERARAWPLEEQVSSLPAFSRRAAVPMGSEAAQAESESSRRGRLMRLAGVAAGLLLATVGIYGSLRSASARAEKEGPKKEVSRTAIAADAGAPGGQVAAIPADAALSAAAPANVRTNAGSGNGAEHRVQEVKAAKMPAAELVSEKAAPRAEVAKVTAPKAAVAVEPDVVTKNRRDDAAVEAALAERPKDGKFLFVPAEVMERHLLSARRPVAPAEVKGEQGPARVVLNAFIAKDGTVSRTDVVEGPPRLINSAMAAVSWRRYRPFLVRGQPAAVVTPVTVSYGAAGH